MKLKPKFTQKDIKIDIEQFLEPRLKMLFQAINYVGMEFVTKARTSTKLIAKKPYIYPHEPTGFYDHTANLRASIGYVILENKSVKQRDFVGEPIGTQAGFASGIEVAKGYNGLVLVVVAGMEYAVYVEAKGYDVITNSIPLKNHVEKIIKQFTGLK